MSMKSLEGDNSRGGGPQTGPPILMAGAFFPHAMPSGSKEDPTFKNGRPPLRFGGLSL